MKPDGLNFNPMLRNGQIRSSLKKWSLLLLLALGSRTLKIIFWVSFAVLAVGVLWCAGALFHAFDIPVFVSWIALILLAASLLASLYRRWALLGTLLFEVLLTAVFCLITPEKRFRHTVWQMPWWYTLEVNRLDDGRYELLNVRDFIYRSETDFDAQYLTLTVDPEQISSIDAVFSHWDNQQSIAHSMLGMNFADGTTVVISLETRLPEGASQNAVDGLYRRYGLAMLAGTPEDFYGLRVDHRGETLYVYRLDMDRQAMRATVLSVFERAAELQRNPQFYSTLYRNCTTGLLPMLPTEDHDLGDIRVMLNGMADKMLFDKDLIVYREGESFGSIQARSLVPGLCSGKDAPPAHYGGESEARWLREH